MSENPELTGQVEKLLPGGEALVRSNSSIFLVSNAVPGDRVTILPAGKRRGVQRASLQTVDKASIDRIQAACPVADSCGGCSLQYLNPARHAEIKSEWVLDLFRNSFNRSTLWIPAVEQASARRRRVHWSVGEDGDGKFLGFKAGASHNIVRHQHCMVVSDPLNQLRETVELKIEQGAFPDVESVQALELSDGIHVIVEFGSKSENRSESLPDQPDGMKSAINEMQLQWWFRAGSGTIPITRPVALLHDRILLDDVEIDIRVGPDDFVQGQAEGNREMISQIVDWSQQAKFVVDLFSGVGNLSLPIARATGSRVIGAELNLTSVQAANANAKRLGLNAQYRQVNLFETFDADSYAGADLIILDPPRRGAKKVCDMMGRLLPAKIIMINCDPASGGRDADTLQSLGYRLHTLRALDLFPYAGHVEAMSLWVR
ncbi:MAG: methyltransferase [Mariprofundaceae bacterium]